MLAQLIQKGWNCGFLCVNKTGNRTNTMAKRAVLSDQSIPNMHGFYVDHATLDLSRFEAGNPVLLYMHRRGEVHGKWADWKFEGSQLTAEPVFDVDDPDSNKIAGKYDRGFLVGASLYLYVTEKTTFVQDETGKVWMKQAEVWEASIVDIPGNKNSVTVKLFAKDGEELSDDEVKAFMLSAGKAKIPEVEIQNKNNMSKIITGAVALAALTAYGLTNADSPEEVEGAVVKLSAALNAEKTAHTLEKAQREALEKKMQDQEAVQLSAMLDQAVTDGQILADTKPTFEALGLAGAKKILDGIPKKVVLGAGTSGGAGTGSSAGTDPKNMDEFAGLPLSAQLEFKNNNPDGYAKLFV